MTLSIPLSQGFETTIDDEDADLAASSWHINSTGKKNSLYARRKQRGHEPKTQTRLHRAIFEKVIGRPLESWEIVDHIDGNTLNNRRANLRLATPYQNAINSKRPKNNTSGYKGVWWHKRLNKWAAGIRVQHKRVHLGFFDTPEAGHKAYCEAMRRYHGDFGRAS